MQTYHGFPTPPLDRPSFLTIGNFDGVHRGHQALVAEMARGRARRGLPGRPADVRAAPADRAAPGHRAVAPDQQRGTRRHPGRAGAGFHRDPPLLPRDRGHVRRRLHGAGGGAFPAVRAVDRPRLRARPRARGERGAAGRVGRGAGLHRACGRAVRLPGGAGALVPRASAAFRRGRRRPGCGLAGSPLHRLGRGGARRAAGPQAGLPHREPGAAARSPGAGLRHLRLLGVAGGRRLSPR